MFDELGKVEKLYRQHPQSPLFARLADLYLRRGKVERALALCQEGCRRFPHYPTGHLILGKCYEAQGQLEEARSATDQALRLDPENPAGFVRLSKIYQDLGIATLALKSLQQAARFDPLSDKLAEQVDRLTYTVRVESTTVPTAPEPLDVPLTLAPAPKALSKPVPPPAADKEADEPFGLIHTPHAETPAAEEPVPANQEELSATYAGPLEEASLEDLLKRSEEAMAEREIKVAASPFLPAAPAAQAPELPMEDRLEALFRRGDLFAEPAAAAPIAPIAPIAQPEPEPEPEPEPAAPALDEDLFALGAALMAGDSPLTIEPEPVFIAEPEPFTLPEPAPESLVVFQEEELFAPAVPDPSSIAIEPADEALEEGLFSTMASGADLEPSFALPPEESAADLRLDELIDTTASVPPQPEVVLPPAMAEPPAPPPIAEQPQSQTPAPQAETARPRRADDGELIRLFQEIENQEHQELTSLPDSTLQIGALPVDSNDPEGRIATVTLAQIYSSQGFVDRAVETYKKILDQDPGNEEIKRRIAELQQGRKTN